MFRKNLAFLLLVVLLVALVPVGFAQADDTWGLEGWGHRYKLTFNNTGSSTNLIGFAGYVNITDAWFNWAYAQSAGEDIRFTDSDGTTLLTGYEIASWDDGTHAQVFVNITQVDLGSSTDYIYMYCDNATAVDAQDVKGTWNSNYRAIWHFEEASGTIHDSTSYGCNSTSQTGVTYGATGQAGKCLYYDGNDYVTIGDNANLEFTTDGFTFETFAYMDDVSDDDQNLITKVSAAPNLEWVFQIEANGYARTLISNTGSGWGIAFDDSGFEGGIFQDDTWYYLTSLWDGSDVYHYANGAPMNPNPTEPYGGVIANTACAVLIGANAGLSHWITGRIDEMRVSYGPLSSDWVEATYLTMTNNFITYGAAEAPPGVEVGIPTNFTATQVGLSTANLTWEKGAYAEHTIIVGKAESVPTDINDGYVVYNGTGTSTEEGGLNLDMSTIYWHAYSWTPTETTIDYAETSLGGETMQLSVLFIVLVALGFGLFIAAFKWKDMLLSYAAALSWMAVGFWWIAGASGFFDFLSETWSRILIVIPFVLAFAVLLRLMNTEISMEKNGQRWTESGAAPKAKEETAVDRYWALRRERGRRK